MQSSPSPAPSPVAATKVKQEVKPTTPNTSLKREIIDESPSSEPPSKKFGFGMKMAANVSNKNKLGAAVFNANEDDTSIQDEPKKKLSRLLDEDNKEQPTVEDKRKLIKNLIEKIPTVKEELFAYPLKWEVLDQV